MTSPIFILAGEPSGDQLAAHIMRAINLHYQSPKWIGVGGALMQEEGLSSLVDIKTMSIMGFGNAILAYQRLSVLADRLVDQAISAKPKIVLTIDNKGFSIRFAMRLRRRMKAVGWSAPIIHCVAPTVWAWGGWRAKKFVNTLDGLLCLFPFEPEYFRHSNLDTHFIGHPEAFKNYQVKKRVKGKKSESRQIVLLPGSRQSEIKLILPEMLVASKILKRHDPRFSFVLPALPSLLPLIKYYADGYDVDIVEGSGDLISILQSSTAMIATSGTVTLQAALCGTIGVTCYRTGMVSALVGRYLVDLDRVVLPNAILGRCLYPFYFQETVTGKALASALLDAVEDQSANERLLGAACELKSLLTGNKAAFSDLLVSAIQNWLGPPKKPA
jgi:lipid-A-disaccharide synthase